MNDGGDSLMILRDDGSLDFSRVDELYGYKIVQILGVDQGQLRAYPPVSMLTTKNGRQHHLKITRCCAGIDLEVLKCIRHRHIAPVSDVRYAEGREFAVIVTDWVDFSESQSLARELAPGVVGGIFSAIGYLSARLGEMPFNLKPTNIILHKGIVRLYDWFLPYLTSKHGHYTISQDRKGLSQWLVRSLNYPKHHSLSVTRGSDNNTAGSIGSSMDVDEKTEADYQSFLLSLTTTEEDVTDHAWVKRRRTNGTDQSKGHPNRSLQRTKQSGKHAVTFVCDRKETVLLMMYVMLKGIGSRRPPSIADLACLKAIAEREYESKSRITGSDVDAALQHAGSPLTNPSQALDSSQNKEQRGVGYNPARDCYEITCCSESDSGGTNEDVSVVIPNLSRYLQLEGPGEFACCVLDGHAGNECAVYSAHQLLPTIRMHTLYKTDIEEAIRDSCHDVHARFVRRGDKFLNNSGTTVALAIIRNGVLHVANLGDSAVVLASAGQAIVMSKDHLPSDPTERQNVKLRGGSIINVMGIDRVEGELSLTRSIGDSRVASYLSREPHYTSRELTPDDEVLILASDGLWDVLTPDEAVGFILQCKAEVDGQFQSPQSHSVSPTKSASRGSRASGFDNGEREEHSYFPQSNSRQTLSNAQSNADVNTPLGTSPQNAPHSSTPNHPAPPSITIEGSTPSQDGLDPYEQRKSLSLHDPALGDSQGARVYNSISRRSSAHSVHSVESFRREMKRASARSQADESVCTSTDERYDDYQILAEALVFEARERGSQDDIAVCLVILNHETGMRVVPS